MTVLRCSTHREVSSGLIQFHFGLKEAPNLSSTKELRPRFKEEKSLLLYNPQKELPLNLELAQLLGNICFN
jgi:hypothetical protein